MKKIDIFSAHSLKILEKDVNEFKNIFIHNLNLFKKDQRAILGQKFHALICYYLNGFDIVKLLEDLDETEQIIWKNLQNILFEKEQNFIKTEYSFLIKDELKGWNYYLTGRYDAIYKEKDEYTIYDWKTLNLPKNPSEDLQSVVYLYCASKIFKTEKIKMRYLSIEKLNFVDVNFETSEKYKNRIDGIISKLQGCD